MRTRLVASLILLTGAAAQLSACSSGASSTPPFLTGPGVDGGGASGDGGAPVGASDATVSRDGGGGAGDAQRTGEASTAPHDAGSAPGRDAGAASDSGAAPGHDAAACSTCARNWSAYPPIAQVDGATELWALSDIHGDYSACTTLLAAAHLIAAAPATPGAVQWAGGHATLVVVGDMIDKGPDAPDVLRLLAALQVSAAAAGGAVVATMGNHEAEFLANPENSKATGTDGLDPQLTAAGMTPDATAAGDDPIGAFIRDLPFAARVDDWFFCHAGDTQGETLAQLSSDLQAGVDSSGFGATVLSATTSLLEAKLAGSPPQWWDATGNATTLLTTWTQALGVKHLVMGHQPGSVGISGGTTRAKDQMAAEYGGLLFLIDTGMSVDVDATGGALLHVKGVGGASESWEEVLPTGAVKAL